MRLTILTEDRLPDLTDDDRLLLPALRARGLDPIPASWSDPAVDWARSGAVLVRSPWDYYLRPAEFSTFLDRLEAAGPQVLNPIPTLRANADKRYLPALAQAGAPIIPTLLLDSADLPAWPGALPWPEAVIKPAVSGNAVDTARLSAAEWPAICQIPRAGRWLVQPYLPEIEAAGEVSLIYLGGAFSHAVRKIPAPGDFRVQADYGGRYAAITPDPALRAAADRVLAAARACPGCALPDAPLTYARVDGVETAEGFLLMELELLEPNLFLAWHPEAPERLAAAVAAALG